MLGKQVHRLTIKLTAIPVQQMTCRKQRTKILTKAGTAQHNTSRLREDTVSLLRPRFGSIFFVPNIRESQLKIKRHKRNICMEW